MAMDEARWRRVEALYHTASERAPESRAAFLDGACSDPDLRREVPVDYATKNARHVVTTKVWVTMAARMLPAWLRARPQNQPSVAASGTQRQFGKLPSHR